MKSTERKIRHVAIIPDGNRHWAKKRGLLPWQGHVRAAKRITEVVRAAFELEIPYLTVWGGSYDNLTKRSEKEIRVLDNIYRSLAKKFIKDKDAGKRGVRIRVLGEWLKLLSKETVQALYRAEETTKEHNNYNLTLLIGYNGDREMIAAVNQLLSGGVKKISEEDLKGRLWTKDLPPVNLIIRTGGEPHLSTGFMMWDTRHSQLYFTEKMWPDFTAKDIKDTIAYYERRERRLGA